MRSRRPNWWKVLFWIGILPALLILYIRRNVEESRLFRAPAGIQAGALAGLAIFKPPLLRTTSLASLLCGGMLAAYYSVTTWLPTYLNTERLLSVPGTSAYVLVLIAGSFAGYLTSAWLSDRLGRRWCFIVFAIVAMILVLAYMNLPVTDAAMLLLGFPLGFFLSGIMAGVGAFLSELYPTAIRGSGQGFCYNFGRAAGAMCPALIGAWSARWPLGSLICGMTVSAYAVVIMAALALPETRGRELPSGEAVTRG